MDIERRIKMRFGDDCFVVSVDGDQVAFSDGEYTYTTSKKYGNISGQKKGLLIMTKESKIKFYNAKCIDDVRLTNFCLKKNKVNYGTFIHVPTGRTYVRTFQPKTINKTSRNVKKAALPREKFDDKIKEFKHISYEEDDYVNSTIKIKLTCSYHGDFYTAPRTFLGTINGCPNCANENKYDFSWSSFQRCCVDNVGYVYLIECFNEEERFLKVGITSKKNVNLRFSKKQYMPYSYVILEVTAKRAKEICRFEEIIKVKLRGKEYTPALDFHGKRECFSIDSKNLAVLAFSSLSKCNNFAV